MSEIDIRHPPTDPAGPANAAPAGHNGGPPLDDAHAGMGQRRNWKLLLLEGGASRGLEKPLARHRRVPHQKSRAAGPHLRRIHAGNSRTRPSPADRGRRTDCRDQAGRAARAAGNRRRRSTSFARSRFMPDIQIRALQSSPDICAMLSEMLVEAVANGGSVSFMHPLPLEAARSILARLAWPRPTAASGSFSAPLMAKS